MKPHATFNTTECETGGIIELFEEEEEDDDGLTEGCLVQEAKIIKIDRAIVVKIVFMFLFVLRLVFDFIYKYTTFLHSCNWGKKKGVVMKSYL